MQLILLLHLAIACQLGLLHVILPLKACNSEVRLNAQLTVHLVRFADTARNIIGVRLLD